MRLWSVHPKYLDYKGLVALWREGLLAKKVLSGCCKGYVNHPQLLRFKMYKKPVSLINAYLYQVYLEAERRGYKFNRAKVEPIILIGETTVTTGQLESEFYHLLKKLEIRDRQYFEELKKLSPKNIEPNPVFRVIDGGIEKWEKNREIKR
ncbi:MAG: pyrimidine dimer DNA glycosylase/endonuclease V [Candidatus Bathyarchaeia archaeon]